MDHVSSYSNRSQIVKRFYELEEKYKTDSGPGGMNNVLSIFNVTCREDIVPARIRDIYQTGWETYCGLMKSWHSLSDDDHDSDDDDSDDDEELMDEEQCEEIEKRFSQFQETIYHAKLTMFSFMRMTNCNSAFPPQNMLDTPFWHSSMDKGSDMKPFHKLTLYIVGNLFQGRYRRSVGKVMEQILTPGGHPTHAWKEMCDLKSHIRKICDKESAFKLQYVRALYRRGELRRRLQIPDDGSRHGVPRSNRQAASVVLRRRHLRRHRRHLLALRDQRRR